MDVSAQIARVDHPAIQRTHTPLDELGLEPTTWGAGDLPAATRTELERGGAARSRCATIKG